VVDSSSRLHRLGVRLEVVQLEVVRVAAVVVEAVVAVVRLAADKGRVVPCCLEKRSV
jgi:hypothetical protein